MALSLLLTPLLLSGGVRNVVIFGPPGVGKGTQSKHIAERWGLCHVSTGDLLRAEVASGSRRSKRLAADMKNGVLVPDRVLLKPGPLDEEEWKLMRLHPLNGWQLVQGITFLGDATKIIRSHHERWDGKGYPEGLKGEETFLPARIFSIIDTFDAMTSTRPYRKGLPVEVALEEIDRCGGSQFDPYLANEFVTMCDEMGLREDGTTDNLTIVR